MYENIIGICKLKTKDPVFDSNVQTSLNSVFELRSWHTWSVGESGGSIDYKLRVPNLAKCRQWHKSKWYFQALYLY